MNSSNFDKTRAEREEWKAAISLLLERRDDYILEEPVPTRFDDEEWEW